MGNCCGRESGESASLLPRPSNFKGPGRTLASTTTPEDSSPRNDAPEDTSPVQLSQQPSSLPNLNASTGDGGPSADGPIRGETAEERREKLCSAAEKRGSKGGGELAQKLAQRTGQGVSSTHREDAAQSLRYREMDQQQDLLHGD